MDSRVSFRTRVALASIPWILILIAIGSVQIVRGEGIDAAVFGVAALLLVIDAAHVAAPIPRVGRIRAAVFAAVAGAAGVVLVLAPRHGVVAGIVVVAIGLLALPIAWYGTSTPPRRARSDRTGLRRSAVAWAAVTVVLCLWELASFLLGRVSDPAKSAHPAVSDLLDPALDTLPGRVLFVAAWLALGILLVTRRGRA